MRDPVLLVICPNVFPSDPAGVISPPHVAITPDGKAYAYGIFRLTSDLYLVEGLQ